MAYDVVLVFPGKYGSPFPGMPLVLLYLGDVLVKNGYKVRLVDTRLERFEKIDLDNTVCVGISSMTGHQISYGIEAARHIRALKPGMPIIWGGVHPTMLPRETLKSEYADIVVYGEGEETLLEVVRRLQDGGSLEEVKGVAYKNPEGKIIVNPPRELIFMDTISVELPYHLLKIENYMWNFFVQTNRGCPHRCGYCCNTFYHKRHHRHKSPQRVVDEVEYVVDKFGLKEIGFDCDDAFFFDESQVRGVCEGLLERKLDIRWTAPSRLDYFIDFDKEFIRLLVKSGCRTLTFGGDSGSDRLLALIQKDLTTETMLEALKKINRYAGSDIAIDINFILGFPTETREDIELTLRFMDILNGRYPNIRYGITTYTPYPKTPLYDMVVKEFGFVPPGSLEQWGSYNFGAFRAPWLDKRYYDLIDTLSVISRVDFCAKDYVIPSRFSRAPYNVMYRILSLLARARWKHKYFSFPFECKAAKRYVKYRRGYF